MKKLLLAALIAATPAHAWDTYVSHKNWHSIYENKYGGTGSHIAGDATGNEHAEITDETLFIVSPELRALFGTDALETCGGPMSCPQAPRVVDLNASIMRTDLFGHGRYPAMQQGKLEERQLPAMSMWAGLPDFNYTVHDWINKSRRCAALPIGADEYERCHEYRAWLGAGLNSTHMGDLSVKVFGRHHAIALRQAQRAAELRALLRNGGRTGQLPPGDRWYADYVREAELMSLSYEMVGQHFLQDRWSSGHMFSRWGGGSYEDLRADTTNGDLPRLNKATAFGTLTGIVHGSLAVFGKPDPLTAPLIDYNLIGDDRVTPMTWRYSVKNDWYGDPERSVQRGVGDYYYQDIVDDLFDGRVLHPSYRNIARVDPAVPLKLNTQHKIMSHCGGESLRQIIAAFDPNGGRYGEFGLPLPAPDPNKTMPLATVTGRDVSDVAAVPECTDAWATNDSYWQAVRTIAGSSWSFGDGVPNTLAMATVAAFSSEDEVPDEVKDEFNLPDEAYTPKILRVIKPLAIVAFYAHRNMKADQKRTEAAKQTIVRYGIDSAVNGGTFTANGFAYRPNSAYGVPGYYEPEDLDALPWFQEDGQDQPMPSGGKDRSTIDGFFNKARTEDWCKQLYGTERVDKKKSVTLRLLREQGMELEVKARNGDAQAAAEADRYRAACGYLANRVYKAVDPKYPMNGTRFERIGDWLPFDGAQKYGAAYEPICAYFDGAGGTAIRTASALNDHKPYFIKPGYVEQPGRKGDDGYAPKTLENWCAMKPVLEVGKVLNGDSDAVGMVDHRDGDRWLKLQGENIGCKTEGGAVGQVLATDINGAKQSLDVWDGVKQTETGGWSYDNQSMQVRIPCSKKGFPTDATAAMRPDEVMRLPPKKYELELIRPDDKGAKAMYRADGDKTVGRYVVEVHTSWVEQKGLPATGKFKAVWVTYPEWSRSQTEILHDGVYTVSNGVYTKVDLAAYGITVEYRDNYEVTFDAQGAPSWVAAPNKRGYLFSHPMQLPPSIFNGTSSFFFSFH